MVLRNDSSILKCPHPFFIAFIGRSGSTHLMHLINQHPDILCQNESFNSVAFWGTRGEGAGRDIKRFIKRIIGRKRLVAYYLSQIYGRSEPVCRGFEFKFPEHFEAFPDVEDWLKQRSPAMKCLFLYRRNNLKGAVSLQNFKKLRPKYQTANLDNNFSGNLDKLHVDIEDAIRETRLRETLNETYYERVSQSFPVHRIAYEDLVADEITTLNGIFSFLGVRTIHDQSFFTHKTRKISKDNLQDYVENYEALRDHLIREGLSKYVT